jgi:hypothetical protein
MPPLVGPEERRYQYRRLLIKARKIMEDRVGYGRAAAGIVAWGAIALAAAMGLYWLTRRNRDGASAFDDLVAACDRAAENLERTLVGESARAS